MLRLTLNRIKDHVVVVRCALFSLLATAGTLVGRGGFVLAALAAVTTGLLSVGIWRLQAGERQWLKEACEASLAAFGLVWVGWTVGWWSGLTWMVAVCSGALLLGCGFRVLRLIRQERQRKRTLIFPEEAVAHSCCKPIKTPANYGAANANGFRPNSISTGTDSLPIPINVPARPAPVAVAV